MKKAIIRAMNLCKSFSNNGEQNHVLNSIDLEIYEKDFTIIMGPSGSGKSTLLYCLSGMDNVTQGQVMYNDVNITRLNEKKLALLRRGDFGFIFQQMHLISNLTLFENVAVSGYLDKNKSSHEVNERALMLLKKMNLENAIKRLPSQVSGGEQQRAAIARAIINNPRLLFGDEPTGALNKNNTNTVLDLLTTLHEEGQSILLVTHDIHTATRANRLIYMEDGRICGELNLPNYKAEDIKSRETQITSWLSSMSW